MNMKTLLAMATTIAATFVAQAKTIALWPIDHDGTAFDGRNAVSSANPLALVNGSSATGLDWALPPNPDASGMAFSPLNCGTAIASGSGRYTMEATGNFGDRVANTNEFTVEGWVKISATQTASWMIILQAGNGSSAKNGGWILSWRGSAGARKFHLTIPADNNNANGYDNTIGPAALSADFEASLAASWHHLALTHKVDGSQDVWQLYIDGENTIDGTVATVRKNKSGAFTFSGYRNRFYRCHRRQPSSKNILRLHCPASVASIRRYLRRNRLRPAELSSMMQSGLQRHLSSLPRSTLSCW